MFQFKTWCLSGKNDFLHCRLNGRFRNNLKCRLLGSVGTDSQASFVEGSKFLTECVMVYIGVSILSKTMSGVASNPKLQPSYKERTELSE